jgi:hypothetical protein
VNSNEKRRYCYAELIAIFFISIKTFRISRLAWGSQIKRELLIILGTKKLVKSLILKI